MTDVAEDILDHYMAHLTREERDRYLNDPLLHAQVEWARQYLMATDRAMCNEGVSEEARRRVLRAVVYGEH